MNHLAALTWQDWTAIGVGWCLLAVAMGAIPGRLKRVAHAVDPGEDSTWMDLVSVDCLCDSDPVLHERFATIISREWEWVL
jgi:hypothetical protein